MIATIFFSNLKKNTSELGCVYYSLFQLLSAEELNATLSYIYDVYMGKEEGTRYGYNRSDWFLAFHKSMRQTNLFTGCSKTWKQSLLNDEEQKEYDSLVAIMDKRWKKLTKKERSEECVYSWFKKKEPEMYKRYLELRVKKENRETRSINGHLDGALWNLIHVDTKGLLVEIMEQTFKNYTIEIQNLNG